MNAETFCEQFETFAEAPNGVAKLRELILQLAVQGKLVPQDANDEPAIALLAKVSVERERRNGQIPKQRPISSITPDEQLFELPSGWTWARFGDLCLYIEAGWSPKCEERPRVGDEWGVIKISAVTWGRFNPDENKTLPSNLEPRIECEIRSGDFLMTRANTAELVAKSVVVDVTPPRLLLNDKTLRVVFPDSVSPQYVNLFNNGWIARQHYIRVASGTSESMRNVSRENILEMPMPVPPLAEQRRIVEKVDQLLGLCDELAARQAARREARKRLVGATLDRLVSARSVVEFPAHAHRLRDHFDRLFDTPTTIPQLRQAILQLAVQGQLVPQDPNDEPVEKLPTKVEQKKAKWVGPIDEQEMPFPLPPSWMWFRLGDISMLKHGYAFSSEFFTSEPAPFVLTTPGNFYEKGGFRDRESKRKYYSGPVDPEFILKPGDFIIPMTEQAAGLLGSPAFIPDDGRVYVHNQRLGKLSFSKLIAPEFAFWFFNCEFFRGELARTCTGMKVRHTSPDRILRVLFPVPPLSEQKRIVSKVTELLSRCDALEAKLTHAESASTQLLSAAVHRLLQGT